MQLRHGLYFIFFLSVGCNVVHSEDVSIQLKSQEREGHVAAKENNPNVGVEIIHLTEKSAKEMGLTALYQKDPGFTKWCVLFRDIPDGPPYTFQQKRLSQSLPDHYYPSPGPSSAEIVACKKDNMPTGIVVSARGYLPGEKVSIRLSGKKGHREAVFYPLPLLLKKKSGELLAKGTLVCAKPGSTLYEFDICGIGKQEKYKLISHSGDEVLSQDLQGPIRCGLTPEVIGLSTGIAKMEVKFEDGASYSVELPWGLELLKYGLGKK